MQCKVYICGNNLVKNDSIGKAWERKLEIKFPYIDFQKFDPTEDLPEEEEMIIIDTVQNLEKVSLFENMDSFLKPPKNSVHDFDLYWDLKLKLKTGRLKRLKIIGVPPGGKKKPDPERSRESP